MSSVTRTPRTSTLRARLTGLHAATLAVTLAVFALLAYLVLSETLARHHDNELRREANDLAQTLAGLPLTDANIARVFAQSGVGSRLVMVRDDHGALVYRDQALDRAEPTLSGHEALVHAAASGVRTPEFLTVNLERSGEVRFICTPIPKTAAYVQVGDPLGDVRAMQHAIALAWLPIAALVLVLSSYGGWMLVGRALAPMQSVAATLEAVEATGLDRRIDVHGRDRELSTLVSALNRLLDRLQRAFDSLRQFAGDVSHQLQTPLTVMRGTAEAALRDAGDPADATRLEKLIGEVDDMNAALASLRTFALADAPVRRDRLDFTALVGEAVEIMSALGEAREVDVQADLESDVFVQGDAVRLKQAVLNLGDNAVKYTNAGGRVTIRLRRASADAVLEVADTGLGIAASDLPHLFHRQYRAASARRSSSGTGLGLAIAHRIVAAHGGTVGVESAVGRGSTFTVRLRVHEG